jgi:potassium channel subfamily K
MMAGSSHAESNVRTPTTNIIPSSNQQPKAREKPMRLWDPDENAWDDGEPQDWWFASTAIPLLAATLGPLANVLSIAALATPWRSCLVKDVESHAAAACDWNGDRNSLGPELDGRPFSDPTWAVALNSLSLIAGFIGNFFLLCNFTKRVRYIIVLPVTIIMWYISTGILIGITVAIYAYDPPTHPQQVYHQGFWYAVYAAIIYLICSMILMVNMLGHVLGHYPQDFVLLDSHRTLILQTMMFFFWLATGSIVFKTIETNYGGGSLVWSYANALYFCEVTILTVGFGDVYPTNNVSRGLMLPYAVGGIVMLGLVVSSLTTFATDLGTANVVKKHARQSRNKTIGRTVTSSTEYLQRQFQSHGGHPHISAPFNPVDTSAASRIENEGARSSGHHASSSTSSQPILHFTRAASDLVNKARKPKLLLLREEKDRFDAMRRIQKDTASFQKWSSLSFSIVAFALMWCLGALVFWLCERRVQGLTYFRALYFCYVCLLTIGYGDIAPKSNAGRPFFVLWSLIALPTMAFLVKYLSETVISSFKNAVAHVGDFTLLPKHGAWRKLLDHYPRLIQWLQKRKEDKAAQQRLEAGFLVGDDPHDEDSEKRAKTLEQFAHETPTHYDLARRLARTLRKVARDAKYSKDKQYSYEEWLQFSQMIRFTAGKDEDSPGGVDGEEDEGMVEWDWIGEDSPMMARGSEAEFLLDRLCESMQRYIRRISAVALKSGREPPTEAGRAILASGRSRPLALTMQRSRSGEGESVRKRGNSVGGKDGKGPQTERGGLNQGGRECVQEGEGRG